jgi:UDP-N-acetylmuramoyl-tripeptide--D-alanyl-D-alanine ligase
MKFVCRRISSRRETATNDRSKMNNKTGLHLGHILEMLTDYRPSGNEPAISSFVVDSREATPGCVFVAFTGENVDGHDFIPDAFRRGAIAALAQKPVSIDDDRLTLVDAREGYSSANELIDGRMRVYILVDNTLLALQQLARGWRARFDIRIIGITGSVGKTSTKELIHAVLSRRFHTLKSTGNQNNEIGVPLALLNLRPAHERAVIEMGMYAQGEISVLCDMAQPHIGVVTMIGPVHLERLGSMEAIVAAKRELVEVLPQAGVAVLNQDDPLVMGMAEFTRARIFTYGLDSKADLWADDIESMGLKGIHFTMHHQGESLSVKVPLLGRHSVHTALRATAVGLIEGMPWSEIVSGLGALTSQLRLVVIPGPHGALLIDDTYNSNPDSALAALNLLDDLEGRGIAVLGDMLELGEAEIRAHRLVGRRAADVADYVITVGNRARVIAREAVATGLPSDRVFMFEDAPETIRLLEEIIQPGDVVLIKGSLGMRMDRIVTALGRGD